MTRTFGDAIREMAETVRQLSRGDLSDEDRNSLQVLLDELTEFVASQPPPREPGESRDLPREPPDT